MAATKCTRCNAPLAEGAKFCLQCGALVEIEAEEGQDKLVGKIIADRYRVNKVLGEGGMGIVYLAEQKMGAATRKVAIKTLHAELGGDPQLVARFYRECETVIELSHPNTIQFYDFGKLDDGTLYVVMEFIQGGSLASILQSGALEPSRADRILVQVCGSLHEAHQRGIVHRDLKPENIMLTNRGGQSDFVKVLDFGIAKRSEAEDDKKGKLTQQGMVLGTPPYMSPEQFGGQTLDSGSDIYSLGVMAYEMLVGRLPFEAKTPWEWATKHLTAAPIPFESYPELSARIAPHKKLAIMRALSKQRAQRQATVLEFLEEFTGARGTTGADWTVATNGGAILPKDAPARTAAPTPGPMQQGMGMMQTQQATPLPGPMHTPPPGLAPPPGYASQPGFPAQQPYGYTTGPIAQRSSGSGLGKILAVVVILLFIVGGGVVGGIAYFASQEGGDTIATGPGGNVPQIPNVPQVPNIPNIPTNPQLNIPPNPQLNFPQNPNIPTTPNNVDPMHPIGTQDPMHPIGTQDPMHPVGPTGNDHPDTNPPNNDHPSGHDHGGSNPEQDRLARSFVVQGQGALDRNDVTGAVEALGDAQRQVGRRNAALSPLRDALTRKGSNVIGNMLVRGDCTGAQSLFRQLRSVGCEGSARGQFNGLDWCQRP